MHCGLMRTDMVTLASSPLYFLSFLKLWANYLASAATAPSIYVHIDVCVCTNKYVRMK